MIEECQNESGEYFFLKKGNKYFIFEISNLDSMYDDD
jgi:hypothetical protein